MPTKTTTNSDKKWYTKWKTIIALATGFTTMALGIIKLIDNLQPASRLSFMSSDLTVNYVNGKIHTSFFLTINNGGKSIFDIVEPVKAKIWYIPIDTLTNKLHFNWEDYMRTNPCDTVSYTLSYMGAYEPNDSVRNSFDFFYDTSGSTKLKYAVLVRADARFKTHVFLGMTKTDTDFCYNALIRFKKTDSASFISSDQR